MVKSHIPLRTCVGTGQQHPQGALVRFVAVQGVPTPELLLGPHRAPGRGVYVLPTEAALAAAVKKKAFAHRLKTNRPPLAWAELEALLRGRGIV